MFGSDHLDAEVMNKAVERMHSDPSLFKDFFADVRSFGPKSTTCDTDRCRHITLCTLNNLLIDKWNECYDEYNK